MHITPSKIFFTKGVGHAKDELASFEDALRKAGIEKQNLVYVSSIYPPHAKRITKEAGLALLNPGEITFCVMARMSTDETGRLIAASIGCAMPKNHGTYGYLSEKHSTGVPGQQAGEIAEDIAATMLASTLGIKFDPETAWKEREQVYKASGSIFKTFNITQSARAKCNGWTTVIAVAVFADYQK